ncbi:DUF5427 domain-containing protein MTC1 Ecym_5217 [Eremothecium cymbalariae DBVPG|uniref:Maintenance of telomere capping protein 1 n=1 Tax=Eremothecium cymbalariae (strain CBS 270.75 / DBVPG 7215 / KCTC 17166 / NRRL Y-17582) TaxID=931890 RepID=I6ND44_ERECY|nr:hypothetical protein Ecym_5217 [Eremothecium cymbalariae DBVPG\
MVVGTRKSTEADDVLEFLESLPEGTPKGNNTPSANAASSGEKDEDILDFLDELEQSNLPVEGKRKSNPSSKSSQSSKNASEPRPVGGGEGQDENVQDEQKKEAQPLKESGTEEESLNDPITSISNWWSSSGQATVSNIWSKTTERATQLKDRITQEQQDITTKLNQNPVASKIANANSNMLSELTSRLTKFVVGDTEEVLRIHVVHDLVNFHELSYQIESQFDKVLSSQVQGGVRIFVDQWDRPNEAVTPANDRNVCQLNLFQGKPTDGDKLCRANLENAIKLFQKAMDESRKQRNIRNTEAGNEEESRISDVFIGILVVGQQPKHGSENVVDSTHAGSFNFTVALRDISNDVSLIVRSQGFPIRWVDWLEGNAKLNKSDDQEQLEGVLYPSEWVKDWIDQRSRLSYRCVGPELRH